MTAERARLRYMIEMNRKHGVDGLMLRNEEIESLLDAAESPFPRPLTPEAHTALLDAQRAALLAQTDTPR